MRNEAMREYDFVLKFSLADSDTDPEGFVEKLAEAGCDDALVGIGQTGRIALDFARKAPSAMNAVASALKDVKRAIPEAKLIEATPDLVGLTDAAGILSFSRQNMRKLMVNNPDFPHPFTKANPRSGILPIFCGGLKIKESTDSTTRCSNLPPSTGGSMS